MTNLAGEYKGKMMKWEDIVKTFPSRWVYLTDYEKNGPDIIKGRVVGVVVDKENGDMYVYCRDNNIDYTRSRTTDDEGVFLADGSRLISEIDPNWYSEEDLID